MLLYKAYTVVLAEFSTARLKFGVVVAGQFYPLGNGGVTVSKHPHIEVNINNSLLRRMSETVPGTFQHSMQVANLAAEAANRIGANSQLVRTGALYHDIGKMENPAFFTENQSGGVNPHKNLGYEQSAQVVIGHVTDGLKLAEKNNLPKVIKDFITTHHGRGKTKYFYISWKNEHPGEEPDNESFTYPGPNPFSKEQKEAAREAERGGHYYRQRACAVCGHSYWPTHSQQEFCSDECRRINHNRKTLEFYHKKKGNPKPDPEAVPTPKPKEDNAA